ncbi:MAG: hypothetical protein ACT4ON_00595 [Bacteroidota bacterium]
MKKNILLYILLLTVVSSCSQDIPQIDTAEFQTGYTKIKYDALEQLKDYPSPRYRPNNDFTRLYNWMSPLYAGGFGQKDITAPDAIKKGTDIQEELALNWNYFLLISNPRFTPNKAILKNKNSPFKSFIDLANKHPELPLSVTIFWTQMLPPSTFGFPSKRPNIYRQDLPESFYLRDVRINKKARVISYTAPDSLFIADGQVQRKQLELLLTELTRPINIINENGEEPPRAYAVSALKDDPQLINDKNNLGIDNWRTYIATKKKHIRKLYSSQFMDSIPQLKNTLFTFYTIEGGPIDRFDWNASKATNTKIKGNYYSTPDFYPRTPDNWKNWKGAWHGWKWINDGRKIEIKSGDRFFSPFVAAGWAYDPKVDIRPAQWLGLLKCLTVVGAEFFYTGYFNLKEPFSKPENYIWQAAMPAYAQATATYFSDVFKNGNVLFDQKETPIVTYPVKDDDVLVTVRKHDQKELYVIAGTVQLSSNTENFPLQKNIQITLKEETILLNIRRQGSVYIYDKSVEPPICYQLDRWHQYEHPSRWRKYWINEAEIFDNASGAPGQLIKSVYSRNNSTVDFSNLESYILLNDKQWVEYSVYDRDLQHLKKPLYLMIQVKSKAPVSINIFMNGTEQKITSKQTNNWNWIKHPLTIKDSSNPIQTIKLQSLNDGLEINKLIIIDSEEIPDLKNY